MLANILKDVDFGRVAAHVLAMPGAQIVWAVLFIAGAYATLTGYDFFAVRTIGANHVSYPIAALASFTSYLDRLSQSTSAPLPFPAGRFCYRIYSQFGLGIIDVTKICFLTGLTFWLGNLAVLGSGMALRCRTCRGRIFLSCRPGHVRAISIAGLVLLGVYLVWASRRPRTIGIASWTVTLPSGTSTLIQIGIGLADLGCSSLRHVQPCCRRRFRALPLSVMTAFVKSATLLGFTASHAPGSARRLRSGHKLCRCRKCRMGKTCSPPCWCSGWCISSPRLCLALITMACWESVLFVRRSRAGEPERDRALHP